MLKYSCIVAGEHKSRQFQLIELFLEEEGAMLEIEVNPRLVMQLSRGWSSPLGGFVIFIRGQQCCSFNQVYEAYRSNGMLKC
jgi:hypothetical protein